MAKSKSGNAKPKHYRCRVEISATSVKNETSIRFGPGKLVRAEELEELTGKGGPFEGRMDCFEPVRDEDDGNADRP